MTMIPLDQIDPKLLVLLMQVAEETVRKVLSETGKWMSGKQSGKLAQEAIGEVLKGRPDLERAEALLVLAEKGEGSSSIDVIRSRAFVEEARQSVAGSKVYPKHSDARVRLRKHRGYRRSHAAGKGQVKARMRRKERKIPRKQKTRTVYRDSGTGRFISKKVAVRHPKTTESDRVPVKPRKRK